MKASALTSRHKAAIIMLSLDEAVAAELVRNLSEEDLRRLAKAVDEVEAAGPEARKSAFEEFEQRLSAPLAGRGSDYLKTLATSALGAEKAGRAFAAPGSPQKSIDALRQARATTLAELLQEEHPQVAAVVLSQLPSEQAVKVLAAMSQDAQSDLMVRVSQLQEIPSQALEVASDALVRALTAAGGLATSAPASHFDGVTFVADLLNAMPSTESDRLLGSLDEEISGKIREAMFTFEDLSAVDKKSLQTILREVAGERLVLALRTSSESLREMFFGAMSQRAAENLREELSLMGPKRLSEVEAAQREVVEVAMRLATSGQITLPGRGSEDQVV